MEGVVVFLQIWASHMVIADCLETIVANSDLIVEATVGQPDLTSWNCGEPLSFWHSRATSPSECVYDSWSEAQYELRCTCSFRFRSTNVLKIELPQNPVVYHFSHQDLTHWVVKPIIKHHQLQQKWVTETFQNGRFALGFTTLFQYFCFNCIYTVMYSSSIHP